MNEPKLPPKNVLETVEGLKPVAPEVIKEFDAAMNNEVIPEIVKAIEERQLLAAEVRLQQLKC